MNLKKVILVVGGISLLGLPLLLTATGATEFPLKLKSEVVQPISGALRGKLSRATPGCDQSATTTPCEVLNALQAQGAAQPKPKAPQVNPTPKKWLLTETYHNKSLGLSFKYPKEYEVIDSLDTDGKILIRDAHLASLGGKSPALAMTPSATEAFTPSYRSNRTFTSLKDFQVSEARGADHPSLKGVYEKDVIKNDPVFRLPSGVDVLPQMYQSRWFDASGKDVTDTACEFRCDSMRRYVVFKDTTHSAVALSLGMDQELENKIIQSIEYK